MKKLLILCLLPFCVLAAGCEDKKENVGLSYHVMLDKAYNEKGTGRVVPLTIEKGVEMDASISADSRFLIYSSDRDRGNFDIYLRVLSDITTVRLTSHASRDIQPALSPDGKKLVFVSLREDPEGDLFVLDIDSEKLLQRSRETFGQDQPQDSKARNISMLTVPDSGTIRVVRDAGPQWSPDGTSIVFSSTRGRDGVENLWMCDAEGGNMRQLTDKGARYPRFSPDGSKLLYVSYRDEKSNGEIYELDLAANKETRLTTTPAIELYPSYGAGSDEILYTLIDSDTNNDGKIDLQDNSVLMYLNRGKALSYALTLNTVSSFMPRWYNAFKLNYFNSENPNYRGVLVYAEQAGDNININMLPEYGVVPRRPNVIAQYDLAESYRIEDNTDYYQMALLRVHDFYGQASDNSSAVFCARAIRDAVYYEMSKGRVSRAQALVAKLKPVNDRQRAYWEYMARYLQQELAGRNASAMLEETLVAFKGQQTLADQIPFLEEDIADYYFRKGNRAEAAKRYADIIARYPKYSRLRYVSFQLSIISNPFDGDLLNANANEIFLRGLRHQKDALADHVVRTVQQSGNTRARAVIAAADAQAARLTEEKKPQSEIKAAYYLSAMMRYVLARSALDEGNAGEARSILGDTLKNIEQGQIYAYRINILLADIARMEKKPVEEEEYLYNAVMNYILSWNDPQIGVILNRLIDYYESYGAQLEGAGDFATAAGLYKKYTGLMTYIHLLKKFEFWYNDNAARANVLYIEACERRDDGTEEGMIKLRDEYIARINIARLDFDKAWIYGLGYIYSRMALARELDEGRGTDEAPELFRQSDEQLEWALFMDDTFIDPYILKGWVYQFIDYRKRDDIRLTGGKYASVYNRYFPRYLLEQNLRFYEKALDANDEKLYPEKEGNIHLNLANTNFLLVNYPMALQNYRLAARYKKTFGSKREEAIFHYHFGYCYWQSGETADARREMQYALQIYNMLSGNRPSRAFADQYLILYRFFALFDRDEGKAAEAIVWYEKVLELAQMYNLNLDRARVFQEIAWCYEKERDYARALSYLDRSEKLLRDYAESEKPYSYRVSLFGLPYFSISSDPTAVVGNAQIINELTTDQKRMLNLAMQEQIFFQNGDFSRSLDYLQKKLELIADREDAVSVDMRVRTMNNMAMVHFARGNHAEAEKLFSETWDYAASEEVNNIQGMFVSIMNLADLYCYLLENKIWYFTDPLKTVTETSTRIRSYRDNYEKMRYDSELAVLQEDAKARQTEVAPAQLAELRERVEAETALVYARIDLTLSTLDLYRADILYQKAIAATADRTPKGVLAYNREIYSVYDNALSVFRKTLDSGASFSAAERLQLMLNSALCMQRMTQYDRAFRLLGQAEALANLTREPENSWQVMYQQAMLVREAGAQLGPDQLVTDYFNKALALLEEAPLLHAGQYGKIRNFYEDYALFLSSKGLHRQAAMMLEKGNRHLRALRIAANASQVSDVSDKAAVSSYRKLLRDFVAAADSYAVLMNSGADAASPEAKAAALNRDNAQKALAVKGLALKDNFGGMLFNFGNVSWNNESWVAQFVQKNGLVHAWGSWRGQSWYQSFGPTEAGQALQKVLASAPDAVVPRVVSGNCMPLFERNGVRPFIFAGTYNDDSIAAVRCERFPGEELELVAGELTDNTGKNLASYAIVRDNGVGADLLARALFNGTLKPALLIRSADFRDGDLLLSVLDAALYNGIAGVVFAVQGANVQMIKTEGASAERLNLEKSFLAAGLSGTLVPDEKSRLAGAAVSLKKYEAALTGGSLKEARTHLDRWKANSEASLVAGLYALNLSRIEEAGGNIAEARKILEKAGAEQTDSLRRTIAARRIYLALKDLDLSGAKVLLDDAGIYTLINESADQKIFNAIKTMAESNGQESVERNISAVFNTEKTSINDKASLLCLAARYDYLYGYRNQAVELVSAAGAGMNDADRMFALAIGATPAGRFTTARAESIAGLRGVKDLEDLRRKTVQASDNSGDFDVYSQYAIALSLGMLADQGQISQMDSLLRVVQLKRAMNVGLKFDRLLLADRIAGYYARRNMIGEQLELRDYILKQELAGAPLIVRWMNLYQQALLLTRTGRYGDSAAIIEQLRQAPSDTARIDLGLLEVENLLFTGKMKEAEILLNGIKPTDDVRKFSLSLLYAQLERLKILEKKDFSVNGVSAYEKWMLEAIKTLSVARTTGTSNYRYDLLAKGLDFLITVNVKREDNRKALFYAEMKKQAEMWQILSVDGAVDKTLLEQYMVLQDSKENENAAISMMSRDSSLYLSTSLSVIPLMAFQRQLSRDDVVLYLMRNEDDVFVWTISPEYIKFIVYQDGYRVMSALAADYQNRLATRSATSDISLELGNMFKPVVMAAMQKKRVIVIHDEAMQRLPYAIISTAAASGVSNSPLLAEKCRLEFMPSIVLGIGQYSDRAQQFVVANEGGVPGATAAIERAAAVSSGLKVQDFPAEGGVLLYQAAVHHDIIAGIFRTRNQALPVVANGRPMVLLSSEGIQDLSSNALAVSMYMTGCRAMLYAAPYSRDINMGGFIEEMSRVMKREGFTAAAADAVSKLRLQQRFNHPAYWAGLRLYTSGNASENNDR